MTRAGAHPRVGMRRCCGSSLLRSSVGTCEHSGFSAIMEHLRGGALVIFSSLQYEKSLLSSYFPSKSSLPDHQAPQTTLLFGATHLRGTESG